MSDISLNLSVSGMEEGAAVGIDLGTTYSCVGVFKYGKVEIIANDQGSKTTPSYVAFTEDEIIVGDPARQLATRNPDTTIFDAKRLMGKKFYDDTVQNDVKYWPFNVVNENERPKIEVKLHDELKTYYPEEISSMVLRKMKETAECYLGEAVTKAVITVPAYFNDAQRQATKDAAAIAQLDVLRIINEPTAAAIAYGLEKKSTSKRNVMIFDLGGGTFDVSILSIEDGFFEVKSTAGDTHLGGEDFDNRMVNHFAQVFLSEYKKDLTQSKKAMRRLKTACEHAKRTLSAATSADIDIEALYEGIDFYTSITRACFEELNAELFQSTLEPVKKSISDAGLTKDQIDDIVLIGGSSRIPKVRTLLQNFFDGKKLNCSIDPDEAVAYGAALQAAILNGERSDDTKDFLLIDVTPLSLGVGVTLVNGTDVQVVIERNSIVPTRKSTPITTQFDDQHEVWFPVYEGEHSLSKFNSLLGEFALNNIPPARAGKPNFDVTFDIDADGILNVTAVDSATGNKNGITIKYNKDRLSQEEIDRMIKEAQQYKVRNENQKLMTVTKNSLETYLIETKSKISEDRFRYKVNECDKTLVVKKCDEAISWLRSKEDGDLEEFKNKYDELEPIFDLIITMANDPVQTNDMYRKILNINLGASETEIQDGYREAAMKFHPDKIQGDREIANWWFSTILKAKNTLVNLNIKRMKRQ